MRIQYAMVLGITLISTQVFAADEKLPAVWKGEGELGFISTSGNTATQTLNAKLKLSNEREKWKHTAIAEGIRALDKNVVTAERYILSGKTDYKFSEVSYIFGLLKYEDDRFSGYHYQANLIAGYGHKLIKSDRINLAVEVGGGVRRSETLTNTTSNEGIVYGAMDLGWKVSESAGFNEKLTVESGADSTVTKSVTGLKAKINSSLASKITYTIRHVSKVPVGVEKTDREMAITLVYSF